MFRHALVAGVSLGAIVAAGPAASISARQASVPSTVPATLIRQAFTAAYSLDYDEATALARRSVAANPDDPQTHRTLASMLWLHILFKRGAVTVDHFLGGVTKSQITLPKPPPDLEAEFRKSLTTAIALADARLKRNARDVEARHDAGAAYAIQASYQASVEGSVMAAFRSAKRAYDAQEEVLTHQPQRADATFIVGIYRYVVSALSLPQRWLAYIAGFGGGKERGISLIETAARDADTRVDANAALMLIYTREGRHLDALRIARALGQEFPRNRLFVLEEGAAAIRAGLAAEGESALTRGLAILDRDERPKFPGERGLWLYKRGLARVSLNHLADAEADLRAALESKPIGWVAGRIHLELGKIDDLGARRPDALADYRQAKSLCDANNDPICAAEAGRLLSKPFRFPGGGVPQPGPLQPASRPW